MMYNLKFLNTHQLGQLRGPRVGGDDSLFGDPVFVHGAQRPDGHLTFVGFIAADQDAVGLFKVPHCRSLSQELWVGQNLNRRHEHDTCTKCTEERSLVSLALAVLNN